MLDKMNHPPLATPRTFASPFKSELLQPPLPIPTLAQRFKAIHEQNVGPAPRGPCGGGGPPKKRHKGWNKPVSMKSLVDGAALTTIVAAAMLKDPRQHSHATTAAVSSSVAALPVLREGSDGGGDRELPLMTTDESILPETPAPTVMSAASGSVATTTTTSRWGGQSRRREDASGSPRPPIINGRVSTGLLESDIVGPPEEQGAAVADFESSIIDKLFVSQLLDDKKKLIPIMVMKHFRHQLCMDSHVADLIRALPLSSLEHWVEELGPRTITSAQWIALLRRVLGPTARFAHLDAQAVFGFFDIDGGGDIDHRELCNGLVMLRSQDGPMVAVLQRCKLLLQPNNKDTRLAFMTRFELVLMTDAIRMAVTPPPPVALKKTADAGVKQPTGTSSIAAGGKHRRGGHPAAAGARTIDGAHASSTDAAGPTSSPLTPAELAALDKELTLLVNRYTTNKRGQFPFDDVREAVLACRIICRAIDSFTVPRDVELLRSPLSQYFRGDADEGDIHFRLMMSSRSLEKAALVIGHASHLHDPAGRQGGGSRGGGGADRPPVVQPAAAAGWPDDAFCRPQSSGDFAPEEDVARQLYIPQPTRRKASSLKALTRSAAAVASTDIPGASLVDDDDDDESDGGDPDERAFLLRHVAHEEEEPEQPTFFTLRGTLFRQVRGRDPEPFVVPGLVTNVKYSEGRIQR